MSTPEKDDYWFSIVRLTMVILIEPPRSRPWISLEDMEGQNHQTSLHRLGRECTSTGLIQLFSQELGLTLHADSEDESLFLYMILAD